MSTLLMVHRNFLFYNFGNQLFRFMNSIRYFRKQYRFSVKSCCFYIFISCNNYAIARFYFLSCKCILYTARTISLGFQAVTHIFSSFLQCFCRHICMGDSSWTCSYSQYTILCIIVILSNLLFSLFFFI